MKCMILKVRAPRLRYRASAPRDGTSYAHRSCKLLTSPGREEDTGTYGGHSHGFLARRWVYLQYVAILNMQQSQGRISNFMNAQVIAGDHQTAFGPPGYTQLATPRSMPKNSANIYLLRQCWQDCLMGPYIASHVTAKFSSYLRLPLGRQW